MKLIIRFLTIGIAALSPLALLWAQSSPSEKSAAGTSSPPVRNDVYHVYFGKAAPGKAVQLADLLKTPNQKDPMPGHFILLRHQEGGWFAFRAYSAFHTDTLANRIAP